MEWCHCGVLESSTNKFCRAPRTTHYFMIFCLLVLKETIWITNEDGCAEKCMITYAWYDNRCKGSQWTGLKENTHVDHTSPNVHVYVTMIFSLILRIHLYPNSYQHRCMAEHGFQTLEVRWQSDVQLCNTSICTKALYSSKTLQDHLFPIFIR